MFKGIQDIKLGSKVELIVYDPEDGKIDINFICQIENLINDEKLIITAPIFEAKVYPVRVGSKIEAYIYRKNYIYKLVGEIIDRMVVDNIPLLEMFITGKITKAQRRQFFRWQCNIPVTFTTEQHGEHEGIPDNYINGATKDLSGGGFLAKVDQFVDKDAILKGLLKLSGITEVNFSGKVIKSTRITVDGKESFILNVAFTDIGFAEREKIVAYIFNQQRNLLKKGLR